MGKKENAYLNIHGIFGLIQVIIVRDFFFFFQLQINSNCKVFRVNSVLIYFGVLYT